MTKQTSLLYDGHVEERRERKVLTGNEMILIRNPHLPWETAWRLRLTDIACLASFLASVTLLDLRERIIYVDRCWSRLRVLGFFDFPGRCVFFIKIMSLRASTCVCLSRSFVRSSYMIGFWGMSSWLGLVPTFDGKGKGGKASDYLLIFSLSLTKSRWCLPWTSLHSLIVLGRCFQQLQFSFLECIIRKLELTYEERGHSDSNLGANKLHKICYQKKRGSMKVRPLSYLQKMSPLLHNEWYRQRERCVMIGCCATMLCRNWSMRVRMIRIMT